MTAVLGITYARLHCSLGQPIKLLQQTMGRAISATNSLAEYTG